MTKIILAAVLSLGFAGAALAEGEGYATTGDWREVKIEPVTSTHHSVSTPAQAPAPASVATGSFQFNNAAGGQG